MLLSFQCPAPVCSLALGADSAFIVAGCMGGIVAVHALPAWFLLAANHGVSMLASIGDTVRGKASQMVSTNVDSAKGIAHSARDIAGEASSLVRGIFSGLFRSRKSSK